MALIIQCRACRARIAQDQRSCPSCGHTLFKYIVDYWPDGRHGKRIRYALPENVDLETARTIEADIRRAARSGPRDPQPDMTTTFDELAPEYLEYCRLHLTKASMSERTYALTYICRIIGSLPLSQFNHGHVTAYQMKRLAQGVSNKTVNKEAYYIQAFIRWARDEKNLPVEPFTFKKLSYHRPVPVVLSPDEVKRILAVCTPFYRALFLCLYSLGLRFSEAQQLTWDSIDFENKAVVTKQKGGSFKVLPLNKWLEKALKALPQEKGKHIFLSDRTGRPITHNCGRALIAAARKAGIEKRVYPHLLRHSVATFFMGENVNLRKIQAYLGHADVSSTEWYTHVVAGHLRDATEGLFARLSTPTRRKSAASKSASTATGKKP